MLVDFAKKGYIGKALAMPDHVQKVIRKMKTEGFISTVKKGKAKLDQPIPLGYSCAGIVEEVGQGITHGAGYEDDGQDPRGGQSDDGLV